MGRAGEKERASLHPPISLSLFLLFVFFVIFVVHLHNSYFGFSTAAGNFK